jgi:hypothetical protein
VKVSTVAVSGKVIDALHLHLIQCILLTAGEGRINGMNITRSPGHAHVTLDALSAIIVCQAENDEVFCDEWLDLAVGSLEVEIVEVLGDLWEAEALVGGEVLLVERSADLAQVAVAALHGGVRIKDETPGECVGRNLPYALLAELM